MRMDIGSAPTTSDRTGDSLPLVQRAREHIASGNWQAAAGAAREALAQVESAAAHELLGLACWWLSDIDTLFRSRERAFKLFVDLGATRRAARMAVWLDWDYRAFRGEPAVAQGWLRRARRLLGDDTDCAEYGWLLMREADAILSSDAAGAVQASAAATALARRHSDVDLENVALSLEGLARVAAGEVRDGMQQLDEATAAVVGGQFVDRSAAGVTCCHLIMACDLVRDYDRADQWCHRVREYCREWDHPPLFAVCRTQYAGVLISAGNWDAAETELHHAIAELGAMRPGWTSLGLLQLAELRRRQGRLDDARRICEQYPTAPAAWLGQAHIALELGQPRDAERWARRFLRQVPRGNHTARAAALEVIVIAAAAHEGRSADSAELEELRSLAARVDSPALRASAALAEATHEAATQHTDAAAMRFEEAIGLFEQAGAPYDALRARLMLAAFHEATGERTLARSDLALVADRGSALGALGLTAQASNLLRSMSGAPAARDLTASSLTTREREVLARIVEGRTNPQIADVLGLSPHTVHRHVANILTKLGVGTRAAAVAWGVQHGIAVSHQSARPVARK